ncbi:MAG TPA: hypothetical protein PKM25_10870, partial [Candidatus Ozemobacteraceae bacterium]|nr:hypothetical protein [Candidatus Ozemobacteraceae bacterium]
MTHRHGIGSIELLLLVIFLLMFGATLLMVWQFSRISIPNPSSKTNLTNAYEAAVSKITRDTRTAVSAIAGRELLTLESTSGTSIEWSFSGGTLKRTEGKAAPEIFVSGLQQGGFTTASMTPDLVSIWMVPA